MTDEIETDQVTGYLQALFNLLQRYTPYAGQSAEPTSGATASSRAQTRAPSRERRVIVRPEAEAADGQVTAVQAALRNGWRLVDIELRTEGEGRRLAFVLHRSDRPTRSTQS